MLLQVFYVCVAFQEPEQFVDDRLEMEFLGGQQRKTVFEVITRLGAEDTDGSSAGTVAFLSCLNTVSLYIYDFYFF